MAWYIKQEETGWILYLGGGPLKDSKGKDAGTIVEVSFGRGSESFTVCILYDLL